MRGMNVTDLGLDIGVLETNCKSFLPFRATSFLVSIPLERRWSSKRLWILASITRMAVDLFGADVGFVPLFSRDLVPIPIPVADSAAA
jgi:hypothetical protein